MGGRPGGDARGSGSNTMRSCARRWKARAGSCSSTPVMGCARPSRRRTLRWPPRWTAAAGLGLPVRMGLATGNAELRGDDYYGPVLNRAARVMAAGHGGQILLAGSTAGLVEGVDLADLGAHRLRDLLGPRAPVPGAGTGPEIRLPRRCAPWMSFRGICPFSPPVSSAGRARWSRWRGWCESTAW